MESSYTSGDGIVTFTKKIHMTAAYDRRDSNPHKNYGVHGLHIYFSLTHESGNGITFSVATNWQLPQVRTLASTLSKPMAFGVDIHLKIPRYEGQSSTKNCTITGGECYCDGSALLGDEFLETLIAGGDEALWLRMEEQYKEWGGPL